MSSPNNASVQSNNDTRWFIWTIVFLVVTGISLVSYIVLSDNSSSDVSAAVVVRHDAAGKTLTAK